MLFIVVAVVHELKWKQRNQKIKFVQEKIICLNKQIDIHKTANISSVFKASNSSNTITGLQGDREESNGKTKT